MSDPATAVSLPDHCTVINDGILYVYSPAGFQALALKDGGQWQDLPMGVSVAGGQCVLAAAPGKTGDSMYVVGGSANSSLPDYNGLQRYDFSSQKWSTIQPVTKDLQDRQNHRVAYLSDSDNIVVYGGSTTDTTPGLSSQTFAASTQEPYNILSFKAELPLTGAQVITWNSSHAILVGGVAGGNAPNKKVLTFGPKEGWSNSGTSLEEGLADYSIMHCSLVMGSDGSKVLNAYNAGVSPNTVQSIVLMDDNGAPADPGTYIGTNSTQSHTESRKRKRDLTLNDWPTYSSNNAPTIKRTNFALATDGNGLAVLSGGSSDDAISVFNQQKNSWVDAKQLLGSQEPLVVSSISVSSAVPSSTSGSSSITPPSSSSAPTSTSSSDPGVTPPSNNSHTLTVLGATLGSIFGLAALLIIVLLCLRYRKDKKRRAATGYVDEKHNDRLSFADQGTEFMHTAGGSVGHNYSRSMNNSLTSLNIIAGKGKGPGAIGKGHQRKGGSAGSDTSTSALIKPPRSPLGLGDSLEMSQMNSGRAPKLVNIGPQGGRAPPAALTDPPPLSAGAIRSARGQAGRPGTSGSDVRPGSSGSASRGGAIVAGMGRATDNQPSRSSGWSKYFSPNDPASSLGGYAHQQRRKSTDTGGSRSNYVGDSRGTSNVTYPSQTVQPLELNLGPRFDSTLADGQRLSRVATGSPTFAHSRDHSVNGRDPSAHGQTAQLSRGPSGKSTVNSSIGDYSFGSATIGDGAHTATTWTPMSERGFNDKPAQNSANNHNHSDSVGSSIYSRNPQSYYPAYDDRRALYGKSGVSTASTVWPVPPKSPLAEGRDSATLSAFPRTTAAQRPPMPTTVNGQKQYGYNQGPALQKKTPVTEDVSWLNLGGDSTY